MFTLPEGLRDREAPVGVGVIGAGGFGANLIAAVERTPGLRTAAVADLDPARADAALRDAGVTDGIAMVDDAEAVGRLPGDGRRAVLADGRALAAAPVDVVVEATGDPVAAARHAHAALMAGTHVVMATVEADAVVGPALADLADANGVTYSLAYGDQPALVAELVAWARTAGFDVVAAGKGAASLRGNEAIELCAAANATGLPPPADGLHAPAATLDDLPDRLRPVTAGGLLVDPGVVDAVIVPDGVEPAPGRTLDGGVFVVVRAPEGDAGAFLRAKNRDGAYVDDGDEFLAVVRPHHVPGGETTVSVAAAALRNEATGSPRERVAEVVGVAGEPIEPGTTLAVDYPSPEPPLGWRFERAAAADEGDHVPLGLLDGAEVVDGIDAGEPIAYADVDVPESFLYHLRRVGENG